MTKPSVEGEIPEWFDWLLYCDVSMVVPVKSSSNLTDLSTGYVGALQSRFLLEWGTSLRRCVESEDSGGLCVQQTDGFLPPSPHPILQTLTPASQFSPQPILQVLTPASRFLSHHHHHPIPQTLIPTSSDSTSLSPCSAIPHHFATSYLDRLGEDDKLSISCIGSAGLSAFACEFCLFWSAGNPRSLENVWLVEVKVEWIGDCSAAVSIGEDLKRMRLKRILFCYGTGFG
ncbi:hypothetical protein NE237_032152 [Protea cynaroides]|uniref:Wall-associated receptor kinase C-terminal domain-containing protein n=1 Tax=Protea cynaroides TaxID=273540 RepID=A0A9Q0R397_9MAGN|nr:hypothetical protein NE237_032152 [Protea cynaroides]